MDLSIEKRVGIFFLLALITLGIMIELVQDWDPFENRVPYSTYFNAAVGLKVGDPVRLAGVDAGKVRDIKIEQNRVKVDFYVIDGALPKADTVAMIQQTNLLGGTFLGLSFGSGQAAQLPPGSIVASREGASVEELIDSFNRNQNRVFSKVEEILEDSREPFVGLLNRLEAVAKKIDSGEGSLGLLVNDPRLYQDLQRTVAGVGAVVARLEKGEGSLGQLLTDQTLYDELTSTAANLRQISDRINQGKGTIGRLVTEDDVYQNLADALSSIRDIAQKANRGEGSLGKLVQDETLYDEAAGAMTRINSIVGKVDDGKGTLGRLVNEDDLYRDAETALQKVEKTVDGMSDSGPLSALGVVTGTLF